MPAILRPNIIDFEASGFGNDSYPIEVGLVLSTGEKYCTLIRPATGWFYWDQEAECVHGISQDLLLTHGKPVNVVTNELNSLLANQTLYSDGWVVDSHWLSRLYYQAGVSPNFYLRSLEYILKEPQMDMWTVTKHQVTSDLALKRHRASSDALIIQETYVRTQQALHETAVA